MTTEELKKLEEELLDKVDEFFPKIKPEGINKGRGEAAVIVGLALGGFKKILAKRLEERETPMGVSQWKFIGKKYGYWKFF